MPFFFRNFPTAKYDVHTLGGDTLRQSIGAKHDFLRDLVTVQNPLVRYKIKDILKSKTALYYTRTVNDNETAEFIAERYYGDESLDWVLYVTNDIIDPYYDWPLEYNSFINYIKKKYGSVPAAQQQVHHYEKIVVERKRLFDGTIVEPVSITIDETTYNTLPTSQKRLVDSYTYEEEANDAKRTIKILQKSYLPKFLDEVRTIFNA